MPAPETPTIRTVEGFLRWTRGLEGDGLLYRGMANEGWRVQASAYRKICDLLNVKSVVPAVFSGYIKRLLDQAKKRGFQHHLPQGNRALSDLELLAHLQHNKAATCLIDFTTNPLVALWFACAEERDHEGEVVNGRVVAMATGGTELFAEVGSKDLEDNHKGKKKIEKFLDPNEPWQKWRPEHLGNRIIAQHSYFVFGPGEISDEHYHSAIIAQDQDNDQNSKAHIRAELAALDISEARLFSDFAGFCEISASGRPYSDYTTEKNMLKGALADLNDEIKRDSNNAATHYNRGQVKRALGDEAGAKKDFADAARLDPSRFSLPED